MKGIAKRGAGAKWLAVGIAMVLSLVAAGCSSSSNEPSVEELREEVSAYAEDERCGNLQDAIVYLNELSEAVFSGDRIDNASDLNASVQSLCQEVIDWDDVPDIVDDAHDEFVDAAEALQDASSEMLAAYDSASIAEATPHIENATSSLEDVTEHSNAYADMLAEINEDLQQESE